MTTDDDSNVVRALLENNMLEETRSYLGRGRRHRDLSDTELDRLCVVELRAIVANYGDKNDWSGVNDMMAEFRLRGRPNFPSGEASDLTTELVALHARAFDPLMTKNPGKLAKKEEALTFRIANLAAAGRNSTKH